MIGDREERLSANWLLVVIGSAFLFGCGSLLIVLAVWKVKSGGLATALGVFGAGQITLALLLPLLEGGIEIGPMGVKVALRRVEKRLSLLGDRVSHLFLFTISRGMYENLMKLSSGHFGPYTRNAGLDRELRHLRDIGYIELETVSGIPGEGADLSSHVRVTDAGREFVELRESILREQARIGT